MNPCLDHANPSCRDARCLVLTRCHAEIPTDDLEGWLEGYYPQALLEGRADLPADLAHRSALFIADRLLDWVRGNQDPHPLDGVIDKRSRSLLVPSEGNGYDWVGLLPVWDWLDANGAWSLVHEFQIIQKLSPEALLRIADLLGIPTEIEDVIDEISARFTHSSGTRGALEQLRFVKPE